MTIESTLERIAVALERMASGQESLPLAAPASAPTAPAATAAPRPRGRPPKVQAEPAPATTEPEPDLPDGGESGGSFLDVEDASPVYTIEQVREAIVGYQKKTGDPEKARKLLKTVGGVDTLRSLPESKFAAVIEACKK